MFSAMEAADVFRFLSYRDLQRRRNVNHRRSGRSPKVGEGKER